MPFASAWPAPPARLARERFDWSIVADTLELELLALGGRAVDGLSAGLPRSQRPRVLSPVRAWGFIDGPASGTWGGGRDESARG